MKQNDYEIALKTFQEINECREYEEELLYQRLYAIKKFLKIWGKERPNGKQEIVCFKCVDILNDLVNGNIKEEYLKEN